MKRYFTHALILLIGVVTISGCLDSYNDEYDNYLAELELQRKAIHEQFLKDSILIVEYLAEHDSVATYHEGSGIYFNIIEPGEEEYPNVYSRIEVRYAGMLLDGREFDGTKEDETTWFNLGQLIGGWQIGVPMIGVGGRIILYLPSFYGFGDRDYDEIHKNSVLIFDIELISFF